jgi:hypothetical protein
MEICRGVMRREEAMPEQSRRRGEGEEEGEEPVREKGGEGR